MKIQEVNLGTITIKITLKASLSLFFKLKNVFCFIRCLEIDKSTSWKHLFKLLLCNWMPNGFVCFIIKVCLESIEDIIFSLRQNSKQEKNIAERWNKNVWCDRQEIRKKNTGQHTPKCPIKNLGKKIISFSVAIYNSKRGKTILNEKRKLKYVAKKFKIKRKYLQK